MKSAFVFVVAACLSMSLAGCAAQPAPQPTPPGALTPRELTIFAASSLTDAMDALTAAFSEQMPGVTIVTNYAGSSSLATQLLEGASADIFAPANLTQMEKVAAAGLLAGPTRTFATNRLIVIVPADNPAGVTSVRDLAAPGVTLVLALPGVPVRDYTDSLLTRLAADPGYGAAFPAALYGNLVSEEANVRQVAAKIALGEADAGIVYASDVTPAMAPRVQQIELPPGFDVAALYPVAQLTSAASPDVAAAFVDFMLSQEGQRILQSWGFGPGINDGDR